MIVKIVDMGDIVIIDYGDGEIVKLTRTGYYHLKKAINLEFLKEWTEEYLIQGTVKGIPKKIPVDFWYEIDGKIKELEGLK